MATPTDHLAEEGLTVRRLLTASYLCRAELAIRCRKGGGKTSRETWRDEGHDALERPLVVVYTPQQVIHAVGENTWQDKAARMSPEVLNC